MNKSRWFHETKHSKGQSIVIIAVALVVMVAMAALILDGGQLYMNRRAAQAAADAAAIAGANEMCKTKNVNNGIVVAENYAMSENGMTDAVASVGSYTPEGSMRTYVEMVVEVTMSSDSFFAGIFGVEENTVKATAGAACFPPAGKSILPVAWWCQPPWLEPEGIFTYDYGICEFAALDYFTELQPLLEGPNPVTIASYPLRTFTAPVQFKGTVAEGAILLEKHIYVIMDNFPTCPPEGTTAIGENPCDINNDGRSDIVGNGNRGWLELDGDAGGGASSLGDWILDGYEGLIQPHMWLPGQPGLTADLFGDVSTVAERIEDTIKDNEIVLIPVFNVACSHTPAPGDECVEMAHNTALYPNALADPNNTCVYPEGSTQAYYHVVGFMEFMITCVDAGTGQTTKDCPGRLAAIESGKVTGCDPAKPNSCNVKAIEGYFVTGYPLKDPEVDIEGVDMGVYVVSLTR